MSKSSLTIASELLRGADPSSYSLEQLVGALIVSMPGQGPIRHLFTASDLVVDVNNVYAHPWKHGMPCLFCTAMADATGVYVTVADKPHPDTPVCIACAARALPGADQLLRRANKINDERGDNWDRVGERFSGLFWENDPDDGELIGAGRHRTIPLAQLATALDEVTA